MDLSGIITGCKEGSEKAREALFDRYAPMVMRIARRYTQSAFEADDVLQEAFITILENINSFDAEDKKGNFDGWVYRVTVNTALKYIRKHLKKQAQGQESGESFEEEEAVVPDHLSAEELHELIDQLPVNQKTVFNLYAIDGYNHDEIAEMLGISVGTSRSHLSRARETLQDYHRKINQMNA